LALGLRCVDVSLVKKFELSFCPESCACALLRRLRLSVSDILPNNLGNWKIQGRFSVYQNFPVAFKGEFPLAYSLLSA
jgi:hypothetical protein